MNIVHKPLFDTAKIISHYEEDGVPISYVCSTELTVENLICDIFYRGETPHPRYGNRYFGIYKDGERTRVCNADMVEDLHFAMIKENDKYHYSRANREVIFVGDYQSIEGGRSMTLVSGESEVVYLRVEAGRFVYEKVTA